MSRTFSFYISRQFLFWFCSVILMLWGIIVLFDLLELFRRTSGQKDATISIVVTMALTKMPSLIEKAVPFATLFGAMLTFWRFNRSHELVVVRAAGVSVWQFLTPVLAVAMAIGIFKVTVFNPFASAMLLRFEQLEARYIKRKSSLAAVSAEGLWLRQATADGHYVMHALQVDPVRMELHKVIIFILRGEDAFVGRIDAPVARLETGYWALRDVRMTGPSGPTQRLANYKIDTDLTSENIQDSFAPPETMSFWALPAFISVLEKAGFSALRHRLYWNSQLASPLLLCAMILLAAMFSLRPVRRGGTSFMVVGGIASGFLLYFLSDVVSALGVSARIPVSLAAWSPAVVSCLLGTSVLFHLEDG